MSGQTIQLWQQVRYLGLVCQNSDGNCKLKSNAKKHVKFTDNVAVTSVRYVHSNQNLCIGYHTNHKTSTIFCLSSMMGNWIRVTKGIGTKLFSQIHRMARLGCYAHYLTVIVKITHSVALNIALNLQRVYKGHIESKC